MKKIVSFIVLAVTLFGLYSCSEDRDSNPTFQQNDSTFVLNMPPLAENNVYDLENADNLVFTTSQPDYGGFPLATTYTTHVSLDGENWTTLGTTSQSAKVSIPASEINQAILDMAGDMDLSQPIPLYVRMTAHIYGHADRGQATSNTIMLPKVQAFVPKVEISLPASMHIVGDFPASSGWSQFVPLHPAYSQDGFFYGIVYLQDGAEFKVNPDAGWKGNDKGYDQVTPEDEAGAGYRMADGNNNMKVDNGGWYNVVVKTKIANADISYTVTIKPAIVYVIGAAEGGNWAKMDEWAFTKPADANGDWVSPAAVGAGELRMFIDCGIDWWKTEFTIKSDGALYYRDIDIPNNWAENKGEDYSQHIEIGQSAYVNFTAATGSVK